MKHQSSTEDTAFVHAFEVGEVSPADFNHAAHVRLAYAYLCEQDVDGAVSRMKAALLAFLNRNGINESKYHETLARERGSWPSTTSCGHGRPVSQPTHSCAPTRSCSTARSCSRTTPPRRCSRPTRVLRSYHLISRRYRRSLLRLPSHKAQRLDGAGPELRRARTAQGPDTARARHRTAQTSQGPDTARARHRTAQTSPGPDTARPERRRPERRRPVRRRPERRSARMAPWREMIRVAL